MNPCSSSKNIIAENLRAVNPDIATRLWLSRRKRMCWKCQQDKPRNTGVLTLFNKKTGGFSSADKFICGDCTAKKKGATNEQATQGP